MSRHITQATTDLVYIVPLVVRKTKGTARFANGSAAAMEVDGFFDTDCEIIKQYL